MLQVPGCSLTAAWWKRRGTREASETGEGLTLFSNSARSPVRELTAVAWLSRVKGPERLALKTPEVVAWAPMAACTSMFAL
jgi:hypothetical protein